MPRNNIVKKMKFVLNIAFRVTSFGRKRHAPEDGAKDVAAGSEKGTKVVVYSTEKGGKKVAHFFEKI